MSEMRVIGTLSESVFLLLARGDERELAERPTRAAVRAARLRIYDRGRGVISAELPFGSYRLANGYLEDVPDDLDTREIVAAAEALLAAP